MNEPKRKQIRLSYYDYNSVGAYFVTICTHEKRRILSDVTVGALHEAPAASVRLTPAGEIVRRVLETLPQRFPDLRIDHSVIMPNHIHLLLRITGERALREAPLQTRADSSESLVGAVHERPVQGEVTGRTIPGESDDCYSRALREAPLQDKRSLLSKAVGFLKMNSSKQIHLIEPDLKVWQRSFYEHVIRNEHDYREIWRYIEGNPGKWTEDKYYL